MLNHFPFFRIFIVGIALFSMFFGGGNLTFPLWLGSTSDSLFSSIVGFILTGVILPFYGVIIGLKFEGNTERILGIFGKIFGLILTFFLILFWIPLGSSPRCIQLAYGALVQMNGTMPLWAYSLIYSFVIYLLTFKKAKILDILGNVITPILIFSLIALIYLGVRDISLNNVIFMSLDPAPFLNAFHSGYYTQDFIAAIFFTSTIINLVKMDKTQKFKMKNIYYSCLIAIILLSIIYMGMIFVGDANSNTLGSIPRDQLLAAIGNTFVAPKFHPIVFLVITLSCITTSAALSVVFADFINKDLTNGKISYPLSLFISIFISFILSTIGFEPLAVIIDHAMSFLYPILLIVASISLFKKK